MSTDDWKWWAGSNDEYYHSSCTTREEAIACLGGEGGFICEAIILPIQLSSFIDATDLLDRADENVDRSENLNEIFIITAEQEVDLDRRLKAACDEWQLAHGLVFRSDLFTMVRNNEQISPEPERNDNV
jgi:hypothetical protein